jgi:hypothetical protein
LKGFANHAADRLIEIVNFELDDKLVQRKRVEFGQVFSRIVSMDLVLHLEEKGFHMGLINNAIITLKQEISSLLNTFHFPDSSNVIVEYGEDSFWLDFSD